MARFIVQELAVHLSPHGTVQKTSPASIKYHGSQECQRHQWTSISLTFPHGKRQGLQDCGQFFEDNLRPGSYNPVFGQISGRTLRFDLLHAYKIT